MQLCKEVHAHACTCTRTNTHKNCKQTFSKYHKYYVPYHLCAHWHANIKQSWEYEAISGTLHIRVTGGGLHCLSGAACRGFSPAAGEPIRVVSGGDETLSPVPPSPAILFKLKQSPANKCHIPSSKNGPKVEFRKSTRWGIGPWRRLFYSPYSLLFI